MGSIHVFLGHSDADTLAIPECAGLSNDWIPSLTWAEDRGFSLLNWEVTSTLWALVSPSENMGVS